MSEGEGGSCQLGLLASWMRIIRLRQIPDLIFGSCRAP